MKRVNAAADPWRPQTRQDREAVRGELSEVLASPQFCNSKRYPALLEYLVKHTLSGDAERLKERTVGIELFGRQPDYDTNTDTIVRYTASEVRKRLLIYYSELDHTPAIRISLPAGSYIPEFIPAGSPHDERSHEGHGHGGLGHDGAPPRQSGTEELDPRTEAAEPPPSATPNEPASGFLHSPPDPADTSSPRVQPPRHPARTRPLIAAAVVALLGAAGWFTYRSLRPAPSALNEFWRPALRGQGSVVVCTGSVVFANKPNYSGTTTAGRDIDYTFVSMQIASAINQLGLTLDRTGLTPQLLPSATTPLTQIRDHSLVLLGGYNNVWTMRLLEPLRFHFAALSPSSPEAIVDSARPQKLWQRNQALPYSSADDYAIVARFRDPTINGWVVALAGIGRNGTEAAAHFATDPHYIQLLRDRIDEDFSDRNIEAVLKVNVIDGKTGAPRIVAVYVW